MPSQVKVKVQPRLRARVVVLKVWTLDQPCHSIMWGLNTEFSASTPALLEKETLLRRGPVACFFLSSPEDLEAAKVWQPLIERLESATYYFVSHCSKQHSVIPSLTGRGAVPIHW